MQKWRRHDFEAYSLTLGFWDLSLKAWVANPTLDALGFKDLPLRLQHQGFTRCGALKRDHTDNRGLQRDLPGMAKGKCKGPQAITGMTWSWPRCLPESSSASPKPVLS